VLPFTIHWEDQHEGFYVSFRYSLFDLTRDRGPMRNERASKCASGYLPKAGYLVVGRGGQLLPDLLGLDRPLGSGAHTRLFLIFVHPAPAAQFRQGGVTNKAATLVLTVGLAGESAGAAGRPTFNKIMHET
jgi:hypothetical protein